MKDLIAAVRAHYDSDDCAALKAATSGMYLGFAPIDTPTPYVVFMTVSEGLNYQMGRDPYYKEAMVQLSIFSDEQSPAEALTIFDLLTAGYDEAALSITGHDLIRVRRSANRWFAEPPGETHLGGWHALAEYEIRYDTQEEP